MARAIWTGSVTFGLVNVPVKLYNATSPKDVRFTQFDRVTGRRIRYRRVPANGEPEEAPPRDSPPREWTPPDASSRPLESGSADSGASSVERLGDVPYEDLVKGYEVSTDRYVMVTPEELRDLRPRPAARPSR